MASVQQKGDSFYCQFFHQGRRHTFTLGRVSRDEAESKAGQVDYLLMRIKQGYVTVPAGTDIVEFVQNDGQLSAPVQKPAEALTLGQLRDRYVAVYSNGAVEENSLSTCRIHFSHLVGTLGEAFVVGGLKTPDLQRHIGRRSPDVEAVTIKKEISTLAAAWNWAQHNGLVQGKFPAKGLVYPKEDEKPPFMTWQEVERRIAAGGDPAELWDCLYLSVAEVAELLEHVKKHARHPFIYPMFCFAAHTSARRSELLRAEVQDVDFTAGVVTIREKKRARGKRTTRRVPLSPFLTGVLKAWLASHPGGQWLFCAPLHIAGSRKHRQGYCPLTAKEAWGHFCQSLAGSRWDVLRGWHVLRHSFISNCASRGVDQRLIDEWAGHSTEAMRKRYRHLLPSTQQDAIRSVFG